MLDLAVIVVSYNTCDLLRGCLSSIFVAAARAGQRLRVQVLVVDNASTDGSPAMVAAEFPQARLFALNQNAGFTGGNNLALAALGFPVLAPAPVPLAPRPSPLAPPPTWSCLLNPDAEIVGDALLAMATFLEGEPAAGACGARLVYGDGHFQHGAFHFPALAQIALDLWPPVGLPGAHRLLDSRLNGRYPQRLWASAAPFPVDFVLGAALMVRGDALCAVGGLDDGYWMYCEEMDWCLRLHEQGWRVYAVPTAQVIHYAGQSSRQQPWASFVRLWRSRYRFYAQHPTHFPPGHLAAVRALVRLALAQRRRSARRGFAQGRLTGIGTGSRARRLCRGGRTVTNDHALAPTPQDIPLYLAAVILTRNEAHNIGACVASLSGWVDQVVVWDSGSSDDTVATAQAAGAVVVQRPFDNYAAQRQAALDAVAAEWIFFVDADERATPALAAEVQQRLAVEAAVGYWTPRRNFIVGHEMRGGGFYPDYQLRLLRRGYARYVREREVHEIVTLAGPDACLTAPLIHYNYGTWAQFHAKQRVYAAYEARILAQRGIHPRPHNFVLQPLREFWRRFVTLQGWRDGWHGVRLAGLLAWYYGFMPYWVLLRQPPAG